jgi:formate hydrogenlyase subunit 3/multisubunit Na+/H+ antiporter MnhD subunit
LSSGAEALPLAALALLLLAAAAVAAVWPAGARASGFAALAACGLGAVLALAALLWPDATPVMLPLGLAGGATAIACDPLSAPFLLLVFIAGAATLGFALPRPGRAWPCLPALLGALTLTLLAADLFLLVLGSGVAALLGWLMLLLREPGRPARSAARAALWMAVPGTAALVAAAGLLAPAGAAGFAALRAAPPEGWRASAAVLLALLGAGAQAGLAPLQSWLPRAHAAAPPAAVGLLGGVAAKLPLYVLIRVVFDLCGHGPGWWALPLLASGAASAVLGGLGEGRAMAPVGVVAAGTVRAAGLVAMALGVAWLAHGADLPPLATLALGAALLLALADGLARTLAGLCAAAAQQAAGTRRLDRLGGLIHRMRVTTACLLLAGASLAALPPAAGFAAAWMLLQAALAVTRIGGLVWPMVVALAAVAAASSSGLAALAMVRLVGIGFLGRPRTPRAAAAEEAPRGQRLAMLGLAAVLALVGLFPGVLLGRLAPALRGLLGAGWDARVGPLGVAAQAEGGFYAPLAVLLLLALGGAGVVALWRWARGPAAVQAPAWDGGFAAAPAWLPFGDPATQPGARAFATAPLLRRPRRWLRAGMARAAAEAVRGPAAPLLGTAAALLVLLLALVVAGPR